MTTLLSRLERMVAEVELPGFWWAKVRKNSQGDYDFSVAFPRGDAGRSVPKDDARAMYASDVRKLVLGLVAKLDDGDAPVPEVVT